MTRSQRNGIISISVARLLYITERIETDKWSSQTLNFCGKNIELCHKNKQRFICNRSCLVASDGKKTISMYERFTHSSKTIT
jgi:hypothetical protein